MISMKYLKRKLDMTKMLLPLLVVFYVTACSPQKYMSTWNEDKIIVDGDQSDWGGKLKYLEDERAAVGVFNDNETLYLCLTTDDRGKIMQMLNLGMTLWIIPDNDNIKTVGIRYPLRLDDSDFKSMRRKQKEGNDGEYVKKMLKGYQEKHNELQIVNEDNYSLYAYPVNNKSGINIKLGVNMRQLVYEISIPIGENSMSEFTIDLFPGDNLTVGFETSEFQRTEGGLGGGMTAGGRQPSGGMTGGGRPGMGNRGGMPQGTMPEKPDPIDIELEVKLAQSK